MKLAIAVALLSSVSLGASVVFEGGKGPGQGRHIVLVSGDDEYRSEEALPQLARILSKHHGFRCTVLFPIDRGDGTVNPSQQDNIPGLEALRGADLMILFTRFRNLPDDQMEPIAEWVRSGKPILAMRTATHAFAVPAGKKWSHWSWNSKDPPGGFGRLVLGETWVAHHGAHAKQSTRGVFAPGKASHPILRGVGDGKVWGPTDVYTVKSPLPEGTEVLMLGQVLTGMSPSDPPLEGPKNDPMMPVLWTRTYQIEGGKPGRAVTTTMGSSQDLENEPFRRLLVNATYWLTGLEKKIRPDSNVEIVGEYKPSPFRFDGYIKGRKETDF